MTRVHRITRRRALKVTAGTVGAALPLVHVQTASAAGKLTMGTVGSLGAGGQSGAEGRWSTNGPPGTRSM